MARFLFRSVISTIVTMLLVSVALFFLVEAGSGTRRLAVAYLWAMKRVEG